MLGEEAKVLLGFLPNSTHSSSQVKAAYKKKALETHPDRFPLSQISLAESNFKPISAAYTCLQSGKLIDYLISVSILSSYYKVNRVCYFLQSVHYRCEKRSSDCR
ncbi:hypothetical protein LXL04_029131 [Taraxacum kok-saghyz]